MANGSRRPPPATCASFANGFRGKSNMVEDYRPDLVYFRRHRAAARGGRAPRGGPLLQSSHSSCAATRTSCSLAKSFRAFERRAIVEDVERGFLDEIRAGPWQTDTCIGNWHYDRRLYDNNGYKTPKQVIQRLVDVVSKNGNLLLNIPVRGNGTIDDKEEAVLDGIAAWMGVNGEAIYGTRPWHAFGEGPTKPPAGPCRTMRCEAFLARGRTFHEKRPTLCTSSSSTGRGKVRIASTIRPARTAECGDRAWSTFQDGRRCTSSRDETALLRRSSAGEPAMVPRVTLRGRGLV